ncbi:hypothetical protein FE72_06715 [Staphylococcus aureus]|nr:hypothetical protein FE72_06715 [Staphylococcus aureus]
MTEIKCTCNKHFSIIVRGPNIENFKKEILQAMQVGGAPTQKLTKSQLTIMCRLGSDNEINFIKYYFCHIPTPNSI